MIRGKLFTDRYISTVQKFIGDFRGVGEAVHSLKDVLDHQLIETDEELRGLRHEFKMLQAAASRHRETELRYEKALRYLVDNEAKDGSSDTACTYCDMGDAGGSSRGLNTHDDACPVRVALEALAGCTVEIKTPAQRAEEVYQVIQRTQEMNARLRAMGLQE